MPKKERGLGRGLDALFSLENEGQIEKMLPVLIFGDILENVFSLFYKILFQISQLLE